MIRHSQIHLTEPRNVWMRGSNHIPVLVNCIVQVMFVDDILVEPLPWVRQVCRHLHRGRGETPSGLVCPEPVRAVPDESGLNETKSNKFSEVMDVFNHEEWNG